MVKKRGGGTVWYFKLKTISISSKEVENFAVMCDHSSLFKMYFLVVSFSIFVS